MPSTKEPTSEVVQVFPDAGERQRLGLGISSLDFFVPRIPVQDLDGNDIRSDDVWYWCGGSPCRRGRITVARK